MSLAELLPLFLVGMSLAADCFAVALGSSMGRQLRARQIMRASLAFGIFQAGMCVAGWFAGRTVLDLISGFDHWIAFSLLVLVGGHMIWESFHKETEASRDITHGWQLIILSIATSIDSLAVGLSYGLLQSNITLAAAIIGVTSFLISLLGFNIGRKVAEIIGHRAELLGGIVLILIGTKILLDHLVK